VSYDRAKVEAFIARERNLAERRIKRGREPKPAAQTPVNSALLPIDHRLLQQLASYGPRAIYPSVPELARKVGCSPRWVQKRLDHLEAHGHLERVAVYERPGEPDWDARGRRVEHKGRQTSNTYRLRPQFTPPGELQTGAETPVNSGEAAAQPPVNPEAVSTRTSSPLEQPEANVQPVAQGTTDDVAAALDLAAAPALFDNWLRVSPPAAMLLDSDPTLRPDGWRKVRATLKRHFGDDLKATVYLHGKHGTGQGPAP
jgi:DNA-binding Lrp family transcriptional regulator